MSIRSAMVYTLYRHDCHTVLYKPSCCTNNVLEVCLKSDSWWKFTGTQTEAHLIRQARPWLQISVWQHADQLLGL